MAFVGFRFSKINTNGKSDSRDIDLFRHYTLGIYSCRLAVNAPLEVAESGF